MLFRLRRGVRRRPTLGRDRYLAYREQARALAYERIAFWNVHYQVVVGRIAIRNSRSRWGSCSKKGNLNFNYRIVALPRRLAEYVVAHELCHLAEFNHSPNFWSLVAETIPDHQIRRKELARIAATFEL